MYLPTEHWGKEIPSDIREKGRSSVMKLYVLGTVN
jgi:hypothetical protein